MFGAKSAPPPPPRRSDWSLTVLQLLIDDYDEIPLGLAAGGSCVDELFISDLDGRRRGHFLGHHRALLVQQRRLFLPGPHGRTRDHVHSHDEGKTVGVPVLAALPDDTPDGRKPGFKSRSQPTSLSKQVCRNKQILCCVGFYILCACVADEGAKTLPTSQKNAGFTGHIQIKG